MTTEPITIPESDYDGPVYYEGAWNDGYLSSIDDFRDWWATRHGEDSPAPAFVWACTAEPLHIPSADHLIDEVACDSYDGAYSDLTANRSLVAALQSAIDAFNAAHGCQQYDVDYSRRVQLSVPTPSDGGR